MKKNILMSLILTLACSFPCFAKSSESLDKMIAIVNDDVITKSELNHAIATVKIQIAQENEPAPSAATLEKQVLEQLINKKLQLQIARQTGVEVSDQELEGTIKKIAGQNNMSVDTLYQQINQQGLTTAEYRTEMRDQLTLQKLQQQEIAGKISVSPEEVTAFAKSQVWQPNDSKEFRIENILVPLPDEPTPEDIRAAKEKASAILTDLRDGKKFKEVVASASQKSAIESNDLGFRKLTDVPSVYATQVARMQKNEIAGPIQTTTGFHIIRLTDVRGSVGTKTASIDRKAIENMLLQRKFEEAMHAYVSKLRSQAFINVNQTA